MHTSQRVKGHRLGIVPTKEVIITDIVSEGTYEKKSLGLETVQTIGKEIADDIHQCTKLTQKFYKTHTTG